MIKRVDAGIFFFLASMLLLLLHALAASQMPALKLFLSNNKRKTEKNAKNQTA